MTFHTFTATLPNGTPITKKSTKPLTHVVIAINEKPDARYFKTWRDLTWEASEARANKVAANKLKNNTFGDYTRVEVIPCTPVADKVKENVAPHTCQLCGRHIWDEKGTLHQHGYEINHGQEIHTCPGSHHLAYEFDCSLIGPEIERLKNRVADKEAWLADFIANPPAEIVEYIFKGIGKGTEKKIYTRPEGFTAGEEMHRSYHFTDTYAYHFLADRIDAASEIAQAKHDQAWHEARLAAWVAPAIKA